MKRPEQRNMKHDSPPTIPPVSPCSLIQRHCAIAESFNAALKNELVHRTVYPTRKHARRDIARYIEFWHNSKRRHSGLQYRSPRQAHNEYVERQSAA